MAEQQDPEIPDVPEHDLSQVAALFIGMETERGYRRRA